MAKDKAIKPVDRSSRAVENQEAPSRDPRSTLEPTAKPHTPLATELISNSIHHNPTIAEPSESFPSQEMPPSLSSFNHPSQPEQCEQDDMTVDVDNDLDYKTTTTDPSAMNLDESKPIHPFFKESYPKSSSSFANAMSKKVRQRLGEGGDDKLKPLNQTSSNLQNVGIGRSTTASRTLNEKVANGSFILNPTRWRNFREKIFLLDRDAIFNESEPKSVRHSKCRKLLQMKEPYNVANFEIHVAKCNIRTTSNTLTIETMFKKEPPRKRAKIEHPPSTQIACPGLSGSNHPRIPLYLERTPSTGGGSSRIDKVSKSLYPKTRYTDLSAKQQQNVIAAQRLHRRWRNEHDLQKVYSMECTKVSHISPFTDSVEPCYQCTALLSDQRFIKVLSKEKPDPENVKYTPKIWINNEAVERWGNIHGLTPIIEEFEKVITYIYLLERK